MDRSELSCSPRRSPPSGPPRPRSRTARSRSDSMEHNDPPHPRHRAAGGADPGGAEAQAGDAAAGGAEGGGAEAGGGEPGGTEPRDALRRLEQRLDRASEAAERLIAEAAAESAAR